MEDSTTEVVGHTGTDTNYDVISSECGYLRCSATIVFSPGIDVVSSIKDITFELNVE